MENYKIMSETELADIAGSGSCVGGFLFATAKGAGAGAVTGVLGGPFGIVGGAVVGAQFGMIGSAISCAGKN